MVATVIARLCAIAALNLVACHAPDALVTGDNALPVSARHAANSSSSRSESRAPSKVLTDPATLPWPHTTAGFAINVHHVSDLPAYLRSIREIADLGANALLVLTPWYQEDVHATEIRFCATRCPSRAQLASMLHEAHASGLATLLMPIVLLERAEPDEWRGKLTPRDPEAWWESYERFMTHFARLAEETGAAMLSIGSELGAMEPNAQRWVELTAHIRETYRGKLTYSVNWDRAGRVEFWPHLDVIGVSAYFSAEAKPGEGPDPAAWTAVAEDLEELAARWGRRVLLTEIGFPSLPWAASEPWNYVAPPQTAPDHDLQAACWQAFIGGYLPRLAASPAHAGFIGFRWDPYFRGGANDLGYGIAGKPAFAIVTEGLARAIGDEHRPQNAAFPDDSPPSPRKPR